MNEPTPTEPEEIAVTAPADTAKIAELRRKAKIYRRFAKTASLGGFLFFGLSTYGFILFPGSKERVYTVYFGVCLVLAGTCTWIEINMRNGRSKAIKELTDGAGVSIIGPLLDDLDGLKALDQVEPVLIALLPRLQATDAALLLPRHHRILNSLLDNRKFVKTKPDTNFLLAILKAYEQVGNKEDLPTVERLARDEGYAKRNKEIREAAQACLPYLQARAEQQEARQTLLRASSESADNGTNLLRPSYGGNTTEPNQLLRASNSETAE